jgi:hypothetical protein
VDERVELQVRNCLSIEDQFEERVTRTKDKEKMKAMNFVAFVWFRSLST